LAARFVDTAKEIFALFVVTTLIKKNTKFYSHIRKFRWDLVAKSSMRKGSLIYEEMRKYLTIYEEAVSHMSLQPIPSEFPYT
jgi:hypothetical protein